MQLGPDDTKAPSDDVAPARAEEIGSSVTALEQGIREILESRKAAETDFSAQLAGEEEAYRDSCEKLKAETKAALSDGKAGTAEAKRQVFEKHRRRSAWIDAAHTGSVERTQAKRKRQTDRLAEELKSAKAVISEDERRRTLPISEELEKSGARAGSLRARAEALAKEIEDLAASHSVRLEPQSDHPKPDGEGGTARFERLMAEVEDDLAQTKRSLGFVESASWRTMARRVYVMVVYLLVVLAHAGASTVATHLKLDVKWQWAALISFLFFIMLVRLSSAAARKKLRVAANRLSSAVGFDLYRLKTADAVATARAEALRQKVLEDGCARSLTLEGPITSQLEAVSKAGEETLLRLRELRDKLISRIDRARATALEAIESGLPGAEKQLRAGLQEELDRLRAEHGREMKRIAKEKKETIEELQSRWRELLDGFAARGRELMQDRQSRHPSWDDPFWQDLRLTGEYPREVPVGSVRVDVSKLGVEDDGGDGFRLSDEGPVTLPLSLSFPTCGSLCLQAETALRGQALDILLDAALRLLCSLPPGKAKLTIIDPVGLGQSFSGLMHLADHDESLVGTRIWTETTHIERRLAELTEHIEKVIQKYLRNRYPTIADYNREAGAMQEPYRFLVIADFPTGFGDLALERLASIIDSGPRCGIFTLIYHDSRMDLPGTVDLVQLRRNGVFLTGQEDAFIVDSDGLRKGQYLAEAPPKGESLVDLLDAVGRQSQDAKRIEVPFSATAPDEGKLWSLSTESGLRVPIGRSGADRLQYIDLGRGTAQHALVAGRTGSGKSTLFHVIITNTALWYGPQEVEFYLIDFKKGVEFKTFGTHQLPHARVVAIESDRGFGVSVLRRVDKELDRRGNLFRDAGVQDLESHRQSGASEHLPRTVLLIDEFQEFFSEDDAVARDAAFLLDRFVRQGRAFGIHVILGSQTLSGVYTLARSTLGQMGVRISLQCNESDSYLILSEENAAARLLSRPGEAIYNDMSGLVEGNNPFQVVWLPDDVEEIHLGRISQMAQKQNWLPENRMVVFEGNIPAEIRNNPLLTELLARPFEAGDAAEAVWLGEPNAIKGPTEVSFIPASGSNLLVMGQGRDTALSVVGSSIISLAARHAPKDVKIIVLDGGGHEAEQAEHFARFAEAVPHEVTVATAREIPEIIEALDGTVARLQDGGEQANGTVYLIVFGLQRLRVLRQDEDYLFSSKDDEGLPTGERFANILRDGPAHGVHTIIWCDSLNNLHRALSRKTLREFDMRILFQMSASDSSELIDTPAASNLGLHNALLTQESDGTLETFRPYAVPDPEYFGDLRNSLLARFSLE